MEALDKIKERFKKESDYLKFLEWADSIYEQYRNYYSFLGFRDEYFKKLVYEVSLKNIRNNYYKDIVPKEIKDIIKKYLLKILKDKNKGLLDNIFLRMTKKAKNTKALFRSFYGMFADLDIKLTEKDINFLRESLPLFNKLIVGLGLEDFKENELYFYYNEGFTYWEDLKPINKSLRWVMDKFDFILTLREEKVNFYYITELDKKNIMYITIKYILKYYDKLKAIYFLYSDLVGYIDIRDFYYIIFNCNLEELKKIVDGFNNFKIFKNKDFLFVIAGKIETKSRFLESGENRINNLRDEDIFRYFLGKDWQDKEKQIVITYLLNQLSLFQYKEVLRAIIGYGGKGEDFIGRIRSSYLSVLMGKGIKRSNYIYNFLKVYEPLKTYLEELPSITDRSYMIYENQLRKIEKQFLIIDNRDSYIDYFKKTMGELFMTTYSWSLEEFLNLYIKIASKDLKERNLKR